LVLKNLPPTIDYSQLKGVVPTASRLELYKKHGKRHAFARFSTTEECSLVASKLRNLKIGGHEIGVAFASHSLSKQPRPATSPDVENATVLHVSNLPFSITQQRLEEEFPTASRVVMNINSHGRFRGSCLLHFDSVDDCRIVRDACRGRQIDGRPLRCVPGIGFQVKESESKPLSISTPPKVFGLKLKGIPRQIDDNQLRVLLESHQLIDLRSSVDSTEQTKTAVCKFKSKNDQRAVLKLLRKQQFFGVQLHAKLWAPAQRKRKDKTKTVPSNGTPQQKSNAMDTSVAEPTKSKKRKRSEMDESNASIHGKSMIPVL
uniref:RRM domain-containing protein n=1 Tax=Echinostoma caproni TaxID=27848 RepID=A0A183AQX7_9TREM